MRDQLVALLGEKTGLDPEKANQVVDTVIGFLKENPEKITEILGDERLDSVKDGIGKLFRR